MQEAANAAANGAKQGGELKIGLETSEGQPRKKIDADMWGRDQWGRGGAALARRGLERPAGLRGLPTPPCRPRLV